MSGLAPLSRLGILAQCVGQRLRVDLRAHEHGARVATVERFEVARRLLSSNVVLGQPAPTSRVYLLDSGDTPAAVNQLTGHHVVLGERLGPANVEDELQVVAQADMIAVTEMTMAAAVTVRCTGIHAR